MKINRMFVVSIALNLALVGCVAWLFATRSQRATGQADLQGSRGSIAATTNVQLTLRPARSLTLAASGAAFDWRQVESEDYKEYLANLRAIGCPEKTVRDIIIADVNDLFAARQTAVTRTNRYEYWKPVPANVTTEQEQQLRDLYGEKVETLKALGVDTQNFSDLYAEVLRGNLEERDLELEFLSESKRQEIKDLRFQMARDSVVAGKQGSDVDEEMDTKIKGLLTPEERTEYDLRCSIPAGQLRGMLTSVEPTEQEFRVIFESWQKLQACSEGSTEYREARLSNESALKQLLGEKRFELYLVAVGHLGYSR